MSDHEREPIHEVPEGPGADMLRSMKAGDRLKVGAPGDSIEEERVLARRRGALREHLTALLNVHSAENKSDTPDFILAQFLIGCLDAWDEGVRQREVWYGRKTSKPCTDP